MPQFLQIIPLGGLGRFSGIRKLMIPPVARTAARDSPQMFPRIWAVCVETEVRTSTLVTVRPVPTVHMNVDVIVVVAGTYLVCVP